MFSLSAWYGIEEADSYWYVFVNTTEVELTHSAVGASPDLSPQNQSNHQDYLYWMTGATVSGLVWACINAMTVIALIELIRTHLALLARQEKIILEE